MNTPSTKQSNNDHRRPRVGLLYLQGLAVYLKYRLLDLGHVLFLLLTAPLRWAWVRLETKWFRLKPWLVRHKRRLIWSMLALVFLSFLIGGGITLYLWRVEVATLVLHLHRSLVSLAARLRRRTEPVVVVATQAVEEVSIPAAPGVDGPVQ